jgi:hypothetical protein
MFETAEILEESVTELCLAFAPAGFEYIAITARGDEWSESKIHYILKYTPFPSIKPVGMNTTPKSETWRGRNADTRASETALSKGTFAAVKTWRRFVAACNESKVNVS